MGPLLTNKKFMASTLVVITFDKGYSNSSGTQHVWTNLLGQGINTTQKTDNHHYDHYSIVRTIELAWGLGNLGGSDVTATPFFSLNWTISEASGGNGGTTVVNAGVKPYPGWLWLVVLVLVLL
ncbi:hypothetical protein BZG36_00985 [Bifiguratus adelaidae]|uniref:Uncharacterized protein n=1 Tax=Bifiguratus adelaidae TaxID=1938954 RepID=A0A261Y676_9FUNG|nr:hypothetical protein BZG36_00985 [Bifiguratus adelaidae]